MADFSVFSGALSGLSGALLLLSIALLSVLSFLTWKVTQIGEMLSSALADLQDGVSLCGTKLTFLEFRLDRATATAGDSLRHLITKITEFDPDIGSEQALKKWVSSERDSWLLRRTTQSWLALAAAAEFSSLNELICLRITEGADTQAEERILRSLKRLPKLLGKERWLSTEH